MNPQNVICVCYDHKGKEVGRVAAAAPNAADYINTLAKFHDGLRVEHVEDPEAAKTARLVSSLFRR